MTGHRLVAEEQLCGDRPVGLAGRPEAEPLRLTSSQTPRRWRNRRAGQCLDPGQIGYGAELFEGPPGRVELQLGAVLVADPPAGQAHDDPRPRRLVWRVELMPGRPRPA